MDCLRGRSHGSLQTHAVNAQSMWLIKAGKDGGGRGQEAGSCPLPSGFLFSDTAHEEEKQLTPRDLLWPRRPSSSMTEGMTADIK